MTRWPYFLKELHKNLQRLVSLVNCVAKAPKVRPITAERLAAAYASGMQKTQPVLESDADRVLAYISERALVRKYADKGPATMDGIRNRITRGEPFLEAQDWFLSDPQLPSSTGGEREQSFARTVRACQELGLLNDRTLTISSYGDCLVRIAELSGVLQAPGGNGRNPFVPEASYSMAAYFQILRCDFVFQRELLGRIPVSQVSFSDLAIQAEELLIAVERAIGVTAANRADREWLAKRLKSARELRERVRKDKDQGSGHVSIQTLYRNFEDILLPRLEFLTDVAALRKPQPGRYVYERGDGYAWLAELTRRGSDGITSGYFSAFAKIYNRDVRPLVEPSEVIAHLEQAFDLFKSMSGYAPIVECAMFANAAAWKSDPWSYVEVSACQEALRQSALQNPPRAHIVSDRFRRPETFRLAK